MSSLSDWRGCDLVALHSDLECQEPKSTSVKFPHVPKRDRLHTIHATMIQHLQACMRQAPGMGAAVLNKLKLNTARRNPRSGMTD
jgi:hypothetical protein